MEMIINNNAVANLIIHLLNRPRICWKTANNNMNQYDEKVNLDVGPISFNHIQDVGTVVHYL